MDMADERVASDKTELHSRDGTDNVDPPRLEFWEPPLVEHLECARCHQGSHGSDQVIRPPQGIDGQLQGCTTELIHASFLWSYGPGSNSKNQPKQPPWI